METVFVPIEVNPLPADMTERERAAMERGVIEVTDFWRPRPAVHYQVDVDTRLFMEARGRPPQGFEKWTFRIGEQTVTISRRAPYAVALSAVVDVCLAVDCVDVELLP